METAERDLHDLGELALHHMQQRNRHRVADCLARACRIAVECDLCPDWLVEAGQFLADVGSWSTLDIRLPKDPESDTPIGALLLAFRAVALRRAGSLDASLREFDRAVAGGALTPAAREFVDLHRTHSLRTSGRYSEAERGYRELVTPVHRYADRARIELADIAFLHGRFVSAINFLSAVPDNADAHGEHLRITGHIWRFNARFEAAEVEYARAQHVADEIQSVGLKGKVLTNLAETAAWHNPVHAARLAQNAVEFNEAIGNQLEVLKAHCALGVALAGRDPAGAGAATTRALELVESSGYRAGETFARVARIFDCLLRHDGTAALENYEKLTEVTDQIGVYTFLRETVIWWMSEHGTEVGDVSPPAAWVDGTSATRARWVDLLTRRRQ